MLKTLVNRARGQVRIRVVCPYPERVLNLCSARNLAFWDLEWEDEHQFTCRVSRRDLRALRRSAEKLECELVVLRREGAPYALRRLRRRQVLAAGIGLWGLWLVLGSLLIWDIRVTGNDAVPREEILRALEKNGVRRGAWGLSVNGEDIRKKSLHNATSLSSEELVQYVTGTPLFKAMMEELEARGVNTENIMELYTKDAAFGA